MKQRIFVLEGNYRDRRAVLEKMKRSLKNFETFVFDRRNKLSFVISFITEISCFPTPRLVILREMPAVTARDDTARRAKCMKAFQEAIPKVPGNNIIVFNNLGLRSEAMLKKVRERGKVFKFPSSLKGEEARHRIMTRFKAQDREINLDAADFMVEGLKQSASEVNVDKLDMLVHKLMNYVGKKKTIRLADVREVCSQDEDFIVWDLFSQFDKKELCAALRGLQSYFSIEKEVPKRAIPLLNQMISRYKLVLMVKDAKERGLSEKEIKAEIGNIKKLTRSGKSQQIRKTVMMKGKDPVPQWSGGMVNSITEGWFTDPVKSYSFDNLLLIDYALRKMEIRIRSGCSIPEILMAFEFVAMVMCEKLTKIEILDVLESRQLLSLEEHYEYIK